MKNLKIVFEQKIKEKKLTKELIYSSIGMTKAGFDNSLKKETLKLKHFEYLVNLLSIEPNSFFEWEGDVKNETLKIEKFELTELDFLRKQVLELTMIIAELSKKVGN